MHYIPGLRNGIISSTVIVLGNVAIVLSGVLNLVYIWLMLTARVRLMKLPIWLVAVNFIFFVFQLILLIK